MTALKRLLLLMLCLCLLGGCTLRLEDDNGFLIFRDTTALRADASEENKETDSREIRCCWLSFAELNPNRLLNEENYLNYLNGVLQPLTRLGVTDLFVHVRPFADAIYPSDLFESSASVVKRRGDRLPFDFFGLALARARALRMRVHAWINPYRILSDARKREEIGRDTPLGKLLFDADGAAVMTTESGLWLQPASPTAQKLILDGVRELLQRYHVAGIHVDDYFYPTDAGEQDAAFYRDYAAAGGTLSLHAWRCEQVNALLRSLYRTVHAADDRLIFSVSPGGNPDADEAACCADAARWCSEPGFCDWIIPQLYYGFDNGTMPFAKTAKRWVSLCSGGVRLIAGLALYKVGKEDAYAGDAGKREWIQDSGVIARQVRLIRRLGYDGFSLFSARFVNFQEKVSAKACQKLERVL